MHKNLQRRFLFSYLAPISFLYAFSLFADQENVFFSQDEYFNMLHEEENDVAYMRSASNEELASFKVINPKKAYTIIIYIAADNDLHPFAWKNIKQMEAIGSNDNINVIVQLHTPGSASTKRYVIKKGKRLLVPADGDMPTQKLNSGSPQTLIDCAAWAMKYYPADNLVINLWDHGSGVYDPIRVQTVNSTELFKFNEKTQLFELDRNMSYLDCATDNYATPEELLKRDRGICFDDTFKSYMNNHDLKFALSEIQSKVLNGKKISILWFDACLMAMLEIANLSKDHVDYLVASEDVEFASGSNYELALQPFSYKVLNPQEFARHIVNSFGKAYQFITQDYTQSAMNLSCIADLEANVDLVSTQLLYAMQDQKNNSVIKVLKTCKTRPACVCFEEPTYIDLRSFYMNLQANLESIVLNDATKERNIKYSLLRLLDQGISLINNAVVANSVGNNVQKAGGISIYFPERGMFSSYPKCLFAQNNSWSYMIAQYLLRKREGK